MNIFRCNKYSHCYSKYNNVSSVNSSCNSNTNSNNNCSNDCNCCSNKCNRTNNYNNFSNNCCCNLNNDNCGNKVPFNFSQKKENTLCSLREVEGFLCNCQKALKCFKFYCFFK